MPPRTLDAQGLRAPSRFAHFVLRTPDLERSIAWYESVVGMHIVHRNPVVAFMTYDDEHHRIALVRTPQQEAAPPGAAGLDHVAYAFDSLGDLLAHYRSLEAKGILPFLAINHGPTTSLYYRDPDGNGVEFQVDNFASETELKGFMESDAFRANPLGVTFDPDALIRRYERGDPEEELLRQGAA